MSVSRNEMKVEAVTRMEMLHVFPQTISQFKDDGKISMSEPPYGALYWIDGDDLERVEQFEEKHDALVYTVIRHSAKWIAICMSVNIKKNGNKTAMILRILMRIADY